jgi:hypothetical protein
MLRRGKHASTTIEELSFLGGPCRGILLKKIGAIVQITRVEAGSNTSTVTLRVVGGDEKGSVKQ